MVATAFSGLDFLATAVMLLDSNLRVQYANPAAENLFEFSSRNIVGDPVEQVFQDAGGLVQAIGQALDEEATCIEHDVTLGTPGHARLHLSASVTPVELDGVRVLLEFQPIEQQLRIAKEERMLDQSQATRTLIRNLAHEIKNPLGGIRGAAQLLERELAQPGLKEYTQVIMKEAGRLQSLMDRMLTPHRLPQPGQVNIHEVLERVRSLVLAENREGLAIRRDYDVSLPPLVADKEQLIQAVLNVARNAAQALEGKGAIVLRTRVTRQVTLAKRRYRHAIEVQIIDNGPGVPEAIRDRIFDPLVSGRDSGHGLGLTLAQTFVNQHGGTIGCESVPGSTCFTILLPVRGADDDSVKRET
ncbi:MAG: PAS domain-containing protein [Betaproteobacteria bacterium]|nr:PAS domain-containing protein [Betaproteobacteria bacterium]